MPHGPELPSPVKSQMYGAYRAGMPIAQIARDYKANRSTVGKAIRRQARTGTSHSSPRSGRPPKLSGRSERLAQRLAKKNRRMPFQAIAVQLPEQPSTSVVRRLMHRVGIHRRKARRKPYLTKTHRQKRMAWVRDVEARGADIWQKIWWSDECYICLGDAKGAVYVSRTAGEVMDEGCIVPTVKQSPIRVMVWGMIAQDYKSPLIILEYGSGPGNGMTADRYIEQVLENIVVGRYLQLTIQRRTLPDVFFMQDNAPSYTAAKTVRYIKVTGLPLFPGRCADSFQRNPH